jgi:hypothetical protein
MTGDAAIRWLWETRYELKLDPVTGGRLTGAAGWHPAGAAVTLRAEPAAGNRFAGWVLDGAPAAQPAEPALDLVMDRRAASAPASCRTRLSSPPARKATAALSPSVR